MENLTSRECRLIYESVQKHIQAIKEVIVEYPQTEETVHHLIAKIDEMEVILDKIGQKTISW